ncbi:MAG: hypothetical protein QNJ97_24880 [Myxococcota bacterium]|nr:hypothetical protein [Myxococcota bacterium]
MAEKSIKIDEQVLEAVIERVLTKEIEMLVAPVIQGLVWRGEEVSAKSVMKFLEGTTMGAMVKKSMDKLGKFERAKTKI